MLLVGGLSYQSLNLLVVTEPQSPRRSVVLEVCLINHHIFLSLQSHSLHGVVLEVWSQLGGHMRTELSHVISHIGDEFRDAGKTLILVLPPPVTQGYIICL